MPNVPYMAIMPTKATLRLMSNYPHYVCSKNKDFDLHKVNAVSGENIGVGKSAKVPRNLCNVSYAFRIHYTKVFATLIDYWKKNLFSISFISLV